MIVALVAFILVSVMFGYGLFRLNSECHRLQGKLAEYERPVRGFSEQIDAQKIIANSNDDIWQLAGRCYDLKPLWESKRGPNIENAAAHHRYAEFATFILNLPEDKQTRDGIAQEIACMDMYSEVTQ